MEEPEGTDFEKENNLQAWRNHALQGCLFQVLARNLEGAKDIPDAAVVWTAIKITEEREHSRVKSRAIAVKIVKQMYAEKVTKFKTLQTKAATLGKAKVRTRVGLTKCEHKQPEECMCALRTRTARRRQQKC